MKNNEALNANEQSKNSKKKNNYNNFKLNTVKRKLWKLHQKLFGKKMWLKIWKTS